MQRKETKPIRIGGQFNIYSVALLLNEKHVVSGDDEGKIRRWRVEDGEEVGMPMDVRNDVLSLAVSRDGKWIVSGTKNGLVTVWNAESGEKVTEFKGHREYVRAVDVSPDGRRIATSSDDKTACIWSLSTGKRLLGPLEHDNWVVDAKFSPDGCLIATATWHPDCGSVRVYEDDRLLVDVNIYVKSIWDKPLAWASDPKQLFVLSRSYMNCLDTSTGTTLSKWPIHSRQNPQCIALANDGAFIAASAGSSVSFWSTATHKRVGPVIELTHGIDTMAISSNHDLVVAGKNTISVRTLCNILPLSYFDVVSTHSSILMRWISDHKSLTSHIQDDGSSTFVHTLTHGFSSISLDKQEPQQNAHQENDSLIQSLRAQQENLSVSIATLTHNLLGTTSPR